VGADPATGAGGASFSSVSGPFFIGGSPYGADTNGQDQLILNVGGTSYAFTPPAGFGNW